MTGPNGDTNDLDCNVTVLNGDMADLDCNVTVLYGDTNGPGCSVIGPNGDTNGPGPRSKRVTCLLYLVFQATALCSRRQMT